MFLRRAKNWVQFQVELFVLRGPFYRLLTVIGLIGLIAVCAGGMMFAAGEEFTTPGEAVWWAFLRLTDPGYLGDDNGVLRRVVSTIITVLGYVVFLGALVAIMTQWFQQTMVKLQEGLTPIVRKQHILVIGWTNRTAVILRELFHSEGRVPMFLKRIGAKRLSVVLLTEADTDEVMRHLANYVGKFWEPARFVLRWGSPNRLNAEHLTRVDFLHASTIILPANDALAANDGAVDGVTIKNLITIADVARSFGQRPPPVVAELLDSRKASLAGRAYQAGPLLVVASDDLISRLLVQNIWNPGLSDVYGELLGHDHGNELYVRRCPEHLLGKELREAAAWFAHGIPIGIVREGLAEPAILGRLDCVLTAGDKLVLIAEDFEASALSTTAAQAVPCSTQPAPIDRARSDAPFRVLVLGWNHKAPALLNELGMHERDVIVDVLARTDLERRQHLLDSLGLSSDGIQVRHHVGDFNSTAELSRFKVPDYDCAVVLASGWHETTAASDSRTIVGYLVLLESCAEGRVPHIIVELLNPENQSLFDSRPGELVVSPLLASHVLTQVALRHELLPVLEELFAHDGAEIVFIPVTKLGTPAPSSFGALRTLCDRGGQIVIGIRKSTGVLINPERDQAVSEADEAVLLLPPRTQARPT